ncbi:MULTISPECIES: hypothetical protein [unclassified Methylobacterium]|uniref:hypothetical protein n=1 Tax=unclassified Methylobacterium TaxID=2615210 RepID=UPI0007012643|nr:MULTISPECIES: hypothetical protein [unclassified Methylobacterium]KQP94888.1 hypothetical protein ASF60_01475 [Methylobacterium sp. Leaf113]MCK2053505.1 hypothetical protein [Methylobacterium sp. 37f]
MKSLTVALALSGLAFSLPVRADSPVVRIRGTIEAVDGASVTIKPRLGAPVQVKLGDSLRVATANSAKIGDIQPDSYIGTAATPQPDGTLKALEVAVFAPSMRGTGDGHYPWDLEKENTMTNGAVGALSGTTDRTITVTYKGGEKTITVPEGVPVVALAPGDVSKIKPGARVVAFTKADAGGVAVADRMIVGENGTVPPM